MNINTENLAALMKIGYNEPPDGWEDWMGEAIINFPRKTIYLNARFIPDISLPANALRHGSEVYVRTSWIIEHCKDAHLLAIAGMVEHSHHLRAAQAHRLI